MTRLLLAMAVVLSLCSCSLVKDWAKNAAKDEVAAQLDARLKAEAPDTHAKLDADQSGKVTLEEWQAYGIPAGVLAFLLEMLRRRMKAKVGSLHQRIDAMAGVPQAAAAPTASPPAKVG